MLSVIAPSNWHCCTSGNWRLQDLTTRCDAFQELQMAGKRLMNIYHIRQIHSAWHFIKNHLQEWSDTSHFGLCGIFFGTPDPSIMLSSHPGLAMPMSLWPLCYNNKKQTNKHTNKQITKAMNTYSTWKHLRMYARKWVLRKADVIDFLWLVTPHSVWGSL